MKRLLFLLVFSLLSGLALAQTKVVPATGAVFTTTGTITSGTVTITATPSVGYLLTATATRPANTTTYTAGDVIGGSPTAVITFTSAGPPSAGASLMLTSCDLQIAATAVPSGMVNMRAQLYSVTPPSALADNAAWDLPSGDRASYLGYFDFGTPVDVGATLYVQVDQINKQIKLAAAENTLYMYLYTAGGFAPASASEVYTIRCRAVGL